MKAIETHYKGYRFRSRLEARWAVFFDTLGVLYEYEKEGFDLGNGVLYLPDFWLPQHDLWVEVKGPNISEADEEKICRLRNQSGKDVVVLGEIPEPGKSAVSETWRGALIDIPIQSVVECPVLWYSNFIQSLFVAAGKDADGQHDDNFGLCITCPLCGSSFVSVGAGTVQPSDDYTAWKGRGSAVRVPMECESGCRWELRFGHHKGEAYCAIENVKAWQYNFLFFLTGSPLGSEMIRRCDEACQAARSARFERGETPR